MNLQRGEICYFSSPAKWLEWKTRRQTVGYSSAGVSFRIAKGVYYRTGAIRPHRITTEDLERVDEGALYITNKRVIFDGSRKNSSWKYSNLIGLEAFADGIVLEKTSGKSPHMSLGGDAELAAVILSAAMNRA